MAWADVGGVRRHYRIDKRDGRASRDGASWLVLSNSLGTDLRMWDAQVAQMSERFPVLRYDTRGHGRSDAPPGPYTIEQMTQDVLVLMDELGLERAHFCGISMGGLTGLALAARHPERIERLVVANTAAQIGSQAQWDLRIDHARHEGMDALADPVMERWFTPTFTERAPHTFAELRATFTATDVEGYAASCAAIRDADLRGEAARIAAPTLVISGAHDRATPPEQGRWLHRHIEGSRYAEMAAAHLSNIEQAGPFTSAVLDFLTGPR